MNYNALEMTIAIIKKAGFHVTEINSNKIEIRIDVSLCISLDIAQ